MNAKSSKKTNISDLGWMGKRETFLPVYGKVAAKNTFQNDYSK